MVKSWLNKDGLYVKYGTDNAGPTTGGEYHNDGAEHLIEQVIDLTKLGSSATIVNDQMSFPQKARISRIDVITDTAATSGGAATLDIGLIKSDRSTEVDFNGFIAGMAKTAIDTTGETNVTYAGGTAAGALLGTTLASSAAGALLCANYGTAAFTAGVIRVRIYYYF